MDKPHVLIVDDDRNVPSLLSKVLDRSGYRVSTAGDGEEALRLFHRDAADVVVTDLRMPRMDGRDFIRRILAEDPDVMVLVLTGYGTIPETVELIRAGVFNVLTKPLGVDDISFMVERAVREMRLKEHNRELERRLETSERLAMIGKLAAGVAHELNNPLDGVSRFVRLSLEGLPERSESREFLTSALDGLKRMSNIVKDLLTFSRNIALEAVEESLERLLGEAVAQITVGRPAQELDVRLSVAVPDLRVPRGLFQVFQNLLTNAADAVGTGGIIEISAGICNGELSVAVRDNGCGIPTALRERVFEPFFTTKEPGRGTGLGLSIVSRIMERYGGGVTLESEVGQGTTVTVFLPHGAGTSKESGNGPQRNVEEKLHPAGR